MNDLKIIISDGINHEEVHEIRQCGNCSKKFNFEQVKRKYPSSCHEQLKKIWDDTNIIFYCSSCYFSKLFKHLKLKKEVEV